MAKQQRKSAPSEKKSGTRTLQIVLAVVVLAGFIGAYFVWNSGSSSGGDSSQANPTSDLLQTSSELSDRIVLPATPRQPRPQTLDPNAFTDPEVRAAYLAAKQAPEVLEHLACYCGCFMSAGHRSNLDCFKDTHGTECNLCRAIAMEGKQLHDQGVPIEQIKHQIDAKWAPPVSK